uniref:Uncharacterized protein n=1 Tax=Capra hircus TaxID=9925 RepID=A0A8C2RGX1_CAPHI
MVEKEEAGGGISEEEAAQYDRQIRLWGLEAQKRSGLVRLGRPRWWEGRSEGLAASRRGGSGTRRPKGVMVGFGSGLRA